MERSRRLYDLAGMERIHSIVELIARAIEIVGVVIIVATVVFASVRFAQQTLRSDRRAAYRHYRANLGRGILLGLELLVGADIIGTITAPLTLESVGLLAVVVLIRTFLSFALETEIEGCWPWQRRALGGDISAGSDPRQRQ